MDEYRETSGVNNYDTLEKIDITGILSDFYVGLRKFWWLVIGLALIFSVKSYFSVSTNYQPHYVASATVTVSSVANGSSYMNADSAQQMAEVFPYILTSGVLKDVVAEDMGMEYMPGTIDVKAEEGMNLLTLSVTADDPQLAYNTLMSVIENYPKVAEFVLGSTKLNILDETGIPSDTQRAEVIRGSYKRGALKGALIGLAIICIYVLSRKTVKSKKELKKWLNLTECGSMPYIREKRRKKESFHSSVSLLNERLAQNYLEAMRKLRIKVLRAMDENEFQTLLVTSSIPGEGKTTLSSNLAIAIAKQGKRVLLIDCDTRNPSLAGAMNNQEPHPGLGEVLRKNVRLRDALTSIEVERGELQVLFGGEPSTKDSNLLGTKGMENLIQALRKQADVIILDTAPSEILADAPILARYVDAALYVIRNDYTKKRQILEGVDSLAMSGINILGYVYNGDTASRDRGYGYKYGYGYNRNYQSGRYGRYTSYAKRENELEKGQSDQYGRVIKE